MKAALLLLATQVLAPRGGQQGLRWHELKVAKEMSAQDARLILVYVACDPGSGKMG